MAKVLCVLYDDPVDGYPPSYARDDIPAIERYPDGQRTPTPERIDLGAARLRDSGRQAACGISQLAKRDRWTRRCSWARWKCQ